jgi:hypothetical protein
MMYLEYLRVRRAFVWYAAGIAIVGLFIVLGSFAGHNVSLNGHVTGDNGSTNVHVRGFESLGIIPIPIEGFVGTAALLALAFATALAASFNRETQHAHFLFVRPVSRYRMAMVTAGVDIASIATAAIFALVVAFLVCSISLWGHVRYVWSSDTLGVAVLGLGAAVMWYALLQALSAWTSRRGGIFVGMGAATLGFAIPLSKATILGPVTYLFKAILLIDPLAYFTSVTMKDNGDVSIGAQFAETLVLRAVIVWLLAAAALAIATISWKRVEV